MITFSWSFANAACYLYDLGILVAHNFLAVFMMLPSDKRLRNNGKSPVSIGKLTVSMAILNSYVNFLEAMLLILVD